MWFQIFFRLFKRSVVFPFLGTLMLQLFAVTFGVLFGFLVHQPAPAQNPLFESIIVGLGVFFLCASAISPFIFFVVGVTTKQNWRIVLLRIARTLGIFLPISATFWTLNGAIIGQFLLPRVMPVSSRHEDWVEGAMCGLILSFPIGVIAAIWRAVALLRREHHQAFVDERNWEILADSA